MTETEAGQDWAWIEEQLLPKVKNIALCMTH